VEYRRLGKTGLRVSQIALGTAGFGMPYGFRESPDYKTTEPQDVIRIVHRALDLGINLIDTARSYGRSEEIIGRALRDTHQTAIIATKVTIPDVDASNGNSGTLGDSIRRSIEASLAALQAEAVDVMQIHNTNPSILARQEVFRALEDVKQQGKVRFLGASGSVCEETSKEALRTGFFQVLQVPFNILDRQIADEILPSAAQQRVGILTRSAFLRGVLTDRIHVPGELGALKEAAQLAWDQAKEKDEVHGLAELALRFCLSFGGVSSVIIGVHSLSELDANVTDAEKGALSPELIDRLCDISMKDRSLLDPQNWKGLI
jgi:aryl-alcohol dehydrogenase-like predicted oxidoreductase